MAITLNLYYTGKDGNALKFAREMEESGTLALIRALDGNLKYEYFTPLEDPETVLLIDSWKSQEALDEYHASPMMATVAALRVKYDLHMRVERFINDDAGIPKGDEKFIRR